MGAKIGFLISLLFIGCNLGAMQQALKGARAKAKKTSQRMYTYGKSSIAKIKKSNPFEHKGDLTPDYQGMLYSEATMAGQAKVAQERIAEFKPSYGTYRAARFGAMLSLLTAGLFGYYDPTILTEWGTYIATLPIAIPPALGYLANTAAISYAKLKYLFRNRQASDEEKLKRVLTRMAPTELKAGETLSLSDIQPMKAILNKPVFDNNKKTLLQKAIEMDVSAPNILNLIIAGADVNPSVPENQHPIDMVLNKEPVDTDILLMLINPELVKLEYLKALPNVVEKRVERFVEAYERNIKHLKEKLEAALGKEAAHNDSRFVELTIDLNAISEIKQALEERKKQTEARRIAEELKKSLVKNKLKEL